MTKRPTPVPDEYDYVARRVQHPWLLRRLWGETLRWGWPIDELLTALAGVFGIDAPRTLWKERGPTCTDEEAWTIEFGPSTPALGRVHVGAVCHEFAHLVVDARNKRMGVRDKGHRHHGPAFVDALDRVAIEAAKLLR